MVRRRVIELRSWILECVVPDRAGNDAGEGWL